VDRDAAADFLSRLHLAQGAFYAGGSDAALRPLLHHDIAWHVPGTSPIAGDYRGFDEVVRYFTLRRTLAAGTMRMQRRELLIGDDGHIAAITDGSATIGGVAHTWSTIGLYRVADDQLLECWLLPLDPLAFDRIWSPGT
jgi:ketosteroid isomerase-like protein